MTRREVAFETLQTNNQNTGLEDIFEQPSELNAATRGLLLKFESLKSIIKNMVGKLGREQFLEQVKKFGLLESVNLVREKNTTDSRILDLAFPLFEALNIDRNEVLLCSLRFCAQDCIDSINNMNPEALLSLKPFQDSFLDLLDIPYLNWIPLVLLDRLPLPKDLSPYYVLLTDKKAMSICSLKVKQALWLKNPAHFKAIYLPLLDKYYNQHKLIKASFQINNLGVSDIMDLRHNNEPLKVLVSLIGTNPILYDQICNSIKEVYLQTGNNLLCNLRFDIVLALQRNRATPITEHEPLLNLIWNLSAINLKESSFRTKAKTILDAYQVLQRTANFKRNFSLGMVFRASFVMDWAVSELFNHIRKKEPVFPELHIVSDMIQTGLESRIRIRDKIEGMNHNTLEPLKIFKGYMEKVFKEVEQFEQMNEIQKDLYFKSDKYNFDTTDSDLFSLLYDSLKRVPVHTLIYFHFLLNRFDQFDYVTLKGAFNLMKNVLITHANAMESYQGSWLDRSNYPPKNSDSGQQDEIFVTKFGLKGFYFPLFQTLCRKLYEPKKLAIFISNENFFHVFAKFLSGIISKYDFAHREALNLILHIQEIVKNHDLLSPPQKVLADMKVIRFTQILAHSYYPKLIQSNKPDQLWKIYLSIFKKQNEYPEYQFDHVNSPDLMALIGFRIGP